MMVLSLKCLFVLLCLCLCVGSNPTDNILFELDKPNENNFSKPFPEALTLVIPIKDSSSVTLHLEKQEGEDEEEENASYADKNHDAIFTISRAAPHQFIYMGGFNMGAQEYSMVPVEYPLGVVEERVKEKWNVVVSDLNYTICSLKPALALDFSNDELPGDLFTGPSFEDAFEDSDSSENVNILKISDKISHQKQGIQELTVELMLVVDYSIFKEWTDFSKGNEKEAINHIKFYYTHIMNGVNDRYSRLRQPSFSISVVVTNLYIARSRSAAPFTASPTHTYHGRINMISSLGALSEWVVAMLKAKKYGWNRFDVVLMVHNYNGGGIVGIANKRSICTKSSATLIQKHGLHADIFTSSHEIAHILGSDHDGYANKCSPKELNIMTPTTIANSANYHNELYFSQCTVQSISRQINHLNSIRKNCLLNRPAPTYHPLDQHIHKDQMPGLRFSLDQQCHNFYGTKSFFCPNGTSGDILCGNVKCYNPSNERCTGNVHNRAMDGTSCNSRHWCVRGKCVQDSRAPKTDEKSCGYGDFKGPLGRLRNLKCSYLATPTYAYLCYALSKTCCKTCDSLQKKNRQKDCPYGDKEKSCASNYCHDKAYKQKCCKTCYGK